MTTFSYTARQSTGQLAIGTLSANNEREAMMQLDQKGLFPVKLTAQKQTTLAKVTSNRKIKPKFLATTFSQMADLLNSGVPLLRSLEILERQSASKPLKEVLGDVRAKVSDGTSLADAFAMHPKAFTDLTVSMVRAGQEGGFLEDVLQRNAEFTEHQEELKAKVIGALAYPIFLSVAGFLIVLALIIFLVPQFESMFAKQKEQGGLPFLTVALLNFSAFLQVHWWWLLGVCVGAFILYRNWANSDDGREKLDAFKLKLPVAGNIVRMLSISRFCRILGTMIKNGIPLLSSLKIAKDSAGNRILARAIEKASEHVTGGKTLSAPLAASGQFPRDVIEMISVGEESNSLETVLIKIADSTERRTTRMLDLMVRLLEPIMLLLLAAVTLLVVLALLMPFMNAGKVFQ